MKFKKFLKEMMQQWEFGFDKAQTPPVPVILPLEVGKNVETQKFVDLIPYLDQNEKQIEEILYAFSIAPKHLVNFDPTIFGKDKKEKIGYILSLINKHFPDMNPKQIDLALVNDKISRINTER